MHWFIVLMKELKLDALIHSINAAGLLALNSVERQMVPLPHGLAGVILPHDQLRSYPDVNGVTVDAELKKWNFLSVTETLTTISSSTVIDGHKVDT